MATVSFETARGGVQFLGANFKDEDVDVTENDDGTYTITIPILWSQSELLLLFEAPALLSARLEVLTVDGAPADAALSAADTAKSNFVSTLTLDARGRLIRKTA